MVQRTFMLRGEKDASDAARYIQGVEDLNASQVLDLT